VATTVLSLIIGLFIGHLVGWVRAHRMVAEECELLGRFFVCKKVFYCTSIADTVTPKELAEKLASGDKFEVPVPPPSADISGA